MRGYDSQDDSPKDAKVGYPRTRGACGWALYLAWVFFKGPLLSKHARVVALLRARARPNSTLIIGCTVYTQLRAVQFLTTFFLVYFWAFNVQTSKFVSSFSRVQ